MGTTFRLGLDDVHRALDAIDPVGLVVAELTGRGLVVPGPVLQVETNHPEPHVVTRETHSSIRVLLSADALRAVRCASLTVIAAQLLVPPGAATVCVLGSGLRAELMMRMLARYVLGISHIAVCAVDGPTGAIVTQRVIDELELSGIGLAITSRVDEATFGANLVGIATTGSLTDLESRHISKAAVLVNCGGRPVPPSVVDHALLVCVGDRALREQHAHRYEAAQVQPNSARRRRVRYPRPVPTDFADLFQDGRTGPTISALGVVVVDVLDPDQVSAALTYEMTSVARRLGLGTATNLPDHDEGRQ
ncbi:hypothetical protein [Dactylosporangium sp. CA-092794]|uniref:hypothetical protein n=1 Tax=Dactylosporangium sp. CA-092794 TaxID=3239929 RepID=UPI003D8DE100